MVKVLTILLLLSFPAHAQLTAAGQVHRLCVNVTNFKPFSPSHVAAADAACGTPAAIAATIAGGATSMTSLLVLFNTMRADYFTILAGPPSWGPMVSVSPGAF